jgi:hypothetical protein
LDDRPWKRLRVEVEVRSDSGFELICGDPRLLLCVNTRTGYHRACVHEGATLASNLQSVRSSGNQAVEFDFLEEESVATIDGEPVVRCTSPPAGGIGRSLLLSFDAGCTLRRLRVCGDAAHAERPRPTRRPAGPFELEVAVDFPDDLHYAPYTRPMFERLFDEYAQWGLKRVHWFYYGGLRRGLWEHAHVGIWENYQRTLDHIGEDDFRHAVRLAHERGLELWGVWKPFELAFALSTLPNGTQAAEKIGKIRRIGGWVYWASHLARERRDLLMRRKPGTWGPATRRVWTRIDLVKEDQRPAAFAADQLRLFISDDNRSYRLYDGPVRASEQIEDRPVWEHTPSGGRRTGASRRCRVMRLDGLELRSQFVAIVPPGSSGSFANTLINLVRVSGVEGEERTLTYGLIQRVPRLAYDIATSMRSQGAGADFETSGIEFDVLPGTPSASLAGFDPIRERHVLDGSGGVLGLARGKDQTTVGCFSPAHDEVRREWLGWIGEILDAGADGVDLRARNHHSHLSWGEFGYEGPVCDEFLARYGVDVGATDDFDRPAMRRLRGEYYTRFYREAKALTASRGKRLRLHISPTLDIEPEVGGAMDLHFDWRTWLRDGLADAVTMKEIYPGTALAEEILCLTASRGIPLIFSPFANALFRTAAGVGVTRARIDWARARGFSGFQLYESCAVFRATSEGGLKLEQPGLRDVFWSIHH